MISNDPWKLNALKNASQYGSMAGDLLNQIDLLNDQLAAERNLIESLKCCDNCRFYDCSGLPAGVNNRCSKWEQKHE